MGCASMARDGRRRPGRAWHHLQVALGVLFGTGHDRKRSLRHASHRVSEKMLSRPFGFPSLMPTPLRGCALRLPRLWPP